jgi:hypothetical protein
VDHQDRATWNPPTSVVLKESYPWNHSVDQPFEALPMYYLFSIKL